MAGIGGASVHTFTYLFGPRVTYRGLAASSLLVRLCLAAHTSAVDLSDNAFAMALGGGVDYKWKPTWPHPVHPG